VALDWLPMVFINIVPHFFSKKGHLISPPKIGSPMVIDAFERPCKKLSNHQIFYPQSKYTQSIIWLSSNDQYVLYVQVHTIKTVFRAHKISFAVYFPTCINVIDTPDPAEIAPKFSKHLNRITSKQKERNMSGNKSVTRNSLQTRNCTENLKFRVIGTHPLLQKNSNEEVHGIKKIKYFENFTNLRNSIQIVLGRSSKSKFGRVRTGILHLIFRRARRFSLNIRRANLELWHYFSHDLRRPTESRSNSREIVFQNFRVPEWVGAPQTYTLKSFSGAETRF
jgi:hypothetical protein